MKYMVTIRLTAPEYEAWKQAAGDRPMAELIRESVAQATGIEREAPPRGRPRRIGPPKPPPRKPYVEPAPKTKEATVEMLPVALPEKYARFSDQRRCRTHPNAIPNEARAAKGRCWCGQPLVML